jgi:hypothetical protein
MIRQPFASEADRLTCARWARAVAIVYGTLAVILFALLVFGTPLGVVVPDQSTDRAVTSAAIAGAHGTVRPAACRGWPDMNCPDVSAEK